DGTRCFPSCKCPTASPWPPLPLMRRRTPVSWLRRYWRSPMNNLPTTCWPSRQTWRKKWKKVPGNWKTVNYRSILDFGKLVSVVIFSSQQFIGRLAVEPAFIFPPVDLFSRTVRNIAHLRDRSNMGPSRNWCIQRLQFAATHNINKVGGMFVQPGVLTFLKGNGFHTVTFGYDLPTSAIQYQRPLVADKCHAMITAVRTPINSIGMFPLYGEV